MESKKVLLVEDDDFLRELYQENLKGEGYQVTTAIDGEDAYQKIKKGPWDLVLLDIVLPKMNGIDVLKKIKSENSPQTYKHLVFLTNLDNDTQLKEAMVLGEGYLVKSQITPGDLLASVKKYLSL